VFLGADLGLFKGCLKVELRHIFGENRKNLGIF
jgi:hypothetical protein